MYADVCNRKRARLRDKKKTKEMNFRSKQNIKFLHAGDQKIGNVCGQ